MSTIKKIEGTLPFFGCVACCYGLLFVPKHPLFGLILVPLLIVQLAYMPIPRGKSSQGSPR